MAKKKKPLKSNTPAAKPTSKKKKSPKSNTSVAKPAAALTASNLPKPRRVPRGQVGEAVQDFIDFGGVMAVETHQESGGVWLVTATA